MNESGSVSSKSEGVAFIGAMNIDCVVQKISRRELVEIAGGVGGSMLSTFAESEISDCEARELLTKVSTLDHRVQLGGSAFNAARAASLVSCGERLGFVGIAGQFQGKHPHYDFFEARGIENFFVEKSSTAAATSVAFVYGGDRTLVTSQGAGMEIGKFLKRKEEELVVYLSTFDAIHVTSLFGDQNTEALFLLLKKVLQRKPCVQISIDPGTIWSRSRNRTVLGVFSLSNLIISGEEELYEIGGKLASEVDEDCANRVFGLMADCENKEIVLRRVSETRIFSSVRGSVGGVKVHNSTIVNDNGVFDPTGAGDTFSGILLMLLRSRRFHLSVAAAVSMSTASKKIQHYGQVKSVDLAMALRSISMDDLEVDALVNHYDD